MMVMYPGVSCAGSWVRGVSCRAAVGPQGVRCSVFSFLGVDGVKGGGTTLDWMACSGSMAGVVLECRVSGFCWLPILRYLLQGVSAQAIFHFAEAYLLGGGNFRWPCLEGCLGLELIFWNSRF